MADITARMYTYQPSRITSDLVCVCGALWMEEWDKQFVTKKGSFMKIATIEFTMHRKNHTKTNTEISISFSLTAI
jgi:hypothetical protein